MFRRSLWRGHGLSSRRARVDRHIMRLVEAGLVRDKNYGRIRVLEFKPDTLTVTLRKGHAPDVELMERTG
jgi:hypothetical protein